jgi:exodeoxyribonuclease-3
MSEHSTPVRILTTNLNGIRSAASKGFFAWLAQQQADVVCVQDLKVQEAEIPATARQLEGLQGYFHCAARKGYSGVGLYTRREPDQVQAGLGWPDIDAEGRYLQADFGRLSIVSLYVPSGSASEERQAVKMDFLRRFLPHLRTLRASRRHVILCGDWNIAHTPKDVKNWRANQTHSGFLPEERAWLSCVLDELGWVDVFRGLNPDAEQYTWWSYRGQAWAKNIGWRIDYQIATPGIAARAQRADIYAVQRFSDHAPLLIDYDYAF